MYDYFEYDSRLALEEWNGVNDPDPFDEIRVEASIAIDMLADALDESGQAVLNLVRNLGDKAFKRNGTLNVNKIAAQSGLPSRTLYRRILKLQIVAQSISLYR